MRYEITIRESNGFLVDVLNVGTRAGNLPTWVIKRIQQDIAYNRTVEIKREAA